MKKSVLLLLFVFFITLADASLGITPAKQEINFIPGQKYEFTFTIISDNPAEEIDLYLAGDLAQYGYLSEDKITGSGAFKVTIILPDEIISPGKHNIIVRGIEDLPETDFIGTRIDIGAPINIFVPYPGRYAELQLNIPHGNIDEEIPVELLAINRGKEDLVLQSVYVDFYTSNEKVGTLAYKPANLSVAEERYFRKFLSTLGYKPGDYVGIAYADYGEIASANQSFRIGYLFVNITNFTQRLPQKGIQKFHVEIESLWGHDLEDIFADVNLSNSLNNLAFRTPPTNLKAWHKSQLEGFVDTSGLEGKYNVDIALRYAGQTTTAEGSLTIYRFSYTAIIAASVIAILVAAGIVVLIIWIRKKNRRRR